MHHQNTILRRITTGAVVAASFSLQGLAQDKPNIIIIYTDDQGYGDLGCYGATGIRTPYIDSLAENGIRFTDFYAPQAVSSASRAGLLTGCYPNRIGIAGALMPNDLKGLNENELTIAGMLREQGYKTGIFGKWHLGTGEHFNPVKYGFDEWYGIPYSNDMLPMEYDGNPAKHGTARYSYPLLPLYHNDDVVARIGDMAGMDSLTRYLTHKAVRFIDDHCREPFFLYFPHPMPHTPLGVSQQFRGTSAMGKYGDVITEIDWSTGQLIESLRQNGILENTIIIFSSDNGPWLNFGAHGGSTAGLREGKGTSWEGGVRVPCVMYWKDRIPAGTVSSEIASAIDIMPTLAEITGGRLPSHIIDGVSLLPVMMGDETAKPRMQFLYYYENNQLQAIRYGDWKLIYPHTYRSYLNVEPGKNGMPGPYHTASCGKELYNLKDDWSESFNLVDSFPEIVALIDAIAQSARDDLGDFLTNAKGRNLRKAGYAFAYDNIKDHKALHSEVVYHSPFSIKYQGGGDSALTDGVLGFPDFTHHAWQGFAGDDLHVKIDLGKTIKISEVRIGFLVNENSWIFLPDSVSIWYSKNGKHYDDYGMAGPGDIVPTGIMNCVELKISKRKKVRYLEVKASNIGVCPPGHPGEGKPAWLFVDEIIVR